MQLFKYDTIHLRFPQRKGVIMHDLNQLEEVLEVFEEISKERIPHESGKCKTEGCEGTVVRRLYGIQNGCNLFTVPACDVCGREYHYAGNVSISGVEEFYERQNIPYGL